MSTVDTLIDELQLVVGDPDGTTYSEDIYERALLAGVKMLAKRWGSKYIVEDGDIIRNPDVTFAAETPIIETGDEYAIILAAVVILRQVALTSSASSFENWSTPDLSYSAGGKERTLAKLYTDALEELNQYFKARLGRSKKHFMWTVNRTFPVITNNPIDTNLPQ